MMEEVYISGPIGKAVFKEGGRYFVLDAARPERPGECRPADLSLFFNFGAEYITLAEGSADLGRVRAALEFRTAAHRALSLLLGGLDAELDNDTRTLAIEAAEELLRSKPARAFVRARLLAAPAPPDADLEGARLLAEYANATAAGRIYAELSDMGGAISTVLDAWAATAPAHFQTREEQTEAENVMVEVGIFADLAAATASHDLELLNSAVVTHSVSRELKARLPQISHLLTDLRSRLTENEIYTSVKESTAASDQSLTAQSRQDARAFNLRDAFKRLRNRRAERKPGRLRPFVAKEKVDKQLAAIEKQIRVGNLNRAERYLQDLISFQVTHSEERHLGMSLCSLAKTAIDFHALELAEKMLNYALGLSVEDVVIWSTHAELLRSMGRLPEALVVYEAAIDSIHGDVVARSGRAEVLKEMGRLDDALEAYDEAVRLFANDAVARSGRAEVLKEMGRLDDALEAYDEAVRLFPREVYAHTGRAEVLKEMGRLNESLEAYEQASQRFPGNGVARRGRASLLMLMNRIKDARAILLDKRPVTYGEWIEFHILSMSYLKAGEIDEAAKRLAYGLEKVPWEKSRVYFATALGVAKMRQKNFAEAIRFFESDISRPTPSQKQKLMALIGHSHAAEGRRELAIEALSHVAQTSHPRLRKLRGDLTRRFTLDSLFDVAPTEAEVAILDERIAEEEFYLAVPV